MGLEEVKKEIMDDAQKEADRIIKDGEIEARKVHSDTLRSIDAYKLQRAEQTKAMLETLEKRELAQAEFDVRKKLLNKKKELVGQVMEAVKEEIKKLPKAEQANDLKILVGAAKKEIDVAVVYASARDVPELKKMKETKGITAKAKEMLGGIIAETADQSISVDYSYEQILEAVKEKNLQEIGNLLFR